VSDCVGYFRCFWAFIGAVYPTDVGRDVASSHGYLLTAGGTVAQSWHLSLILGSVHRSGNSMGMVPVSRDSLGAASHGIILLS
jgi:hypothetical protein